MRLTPLHALAEHVGIAVDWIDAYDQPQRVDDDTLQALLGALGLDCASADDCRASLELLRHEDARLPPLVTGVQHQPIELPVTARLHGQSCRLELENGVRQPLLVSGDVTRAPTLPPIQIAGYHRLFIDGQVVTLAIAPARCFTLADALADATVADGRAHAPSQGVRGWALSAQLYSLRQDSLKPGRNVYGDGGIGHFGAVGELAKMAAAHGAAALAMSPVHAMFGADPGRASPYSPSSRLFLNALLIDPAAVLGEAAQAQALAEGGSELIAAHERLQGAGLVDWERAGAHRMQLLRRLYALYLTEAGAGGGTHQAAFAAFRLQGGRALQAHAVYEAYSHGLASRHQAGSCDWRTWGDDGRNPETAFMRDFARQQSGEVDFHMFLQWQAARGLAQAQRDARAAGMAIGLIADLAVGADNGGSQAWSYQDEIASGITVGAPPDLLAPQGQNWGLGAFSPLAMHRHGYQAYLAMLRACLAQGGGLRIDHVLGLNRMWLVPAGRDASAGAYVRYRLRDMLRLIALESWRHRAVVIGEDLGTVPPGFDQVLDEAGVAGIRVLWFQRGKQHFLPPQQWSGSAIAVTTTHDLPTVAGWWSGADIAWRTRLQHLAEPTGVQEALQQRAAERAALWQTMVQAGSAHGAMPDGAGPRAVLPVDEGEQLPQPLQACETVVDAALDFVAQTPAPLAVIPVEDILGLPQQPNLPGLTEPHPNWRRRLPADVGQLFDAHQARARLAHLARQRGTRALDPAQPVPAAPRTSNGSL
ncbi:4-alpha-glucanotransferase [Herbaspirillum sp. YR522]|uniref:4-alpha-glucanotransferase n=1 Tax=Herbaspirillum sp. YR522 TaxID=1144342 RepID=UPI00026F53F9|nr:4-alpha-glucanotransferase [Herbaspirillum sp. YR522]EJM98627.1 4-alpha-glucanotransferase [Herbaspirillum sp. YR522]